MLNDLSYIFYNKDDLLGKANRGIEVECTVEEGYKTSSIITKYPTVTGFMVSDHTIRQNQVLTMKAIFGSRMYKFEGFNTQSLQAGLLASLGVEGQGTVHFDSSWPEKKSMITSVHNELKTLERRGIPCSVVTMLETHKNCVLTDYEVNQNLSNSSQLHCTLKFEIIEVVEGGGTARAKVSAAPVDKETSDKGFDEFDPDPY